MSSIIKFNLKELRKLANDKNSCVIEKKVTQNIALQPWCLGNLIESLENLLNCKIGKYDKEFNGILLSYKNLNTLQNVGSIRNDNADIHFKVQADYFIFKPHVGATLTGLVNKKCYTHIGVLVHRVFNVVIQRPKSFTDAEWDEIDEGGYVIFQIKTMDLQGTLPDIRGEIIEICKTNGPATVIDYESPVNFDKTKPPCNARKKKKKSESKTESSECSIEKSNGHSVSAKTDSDSDKDIEKHKTKKRKIVNAESEETPSKPKKRKKV